MRFCFISLLMLMVLLLSLRIPVKLFLFLDIGDCLLDLSTGFRALYVHYLYLLGIRKPPHKRQSIPFAVRKEVTRLNRYASQFRFLQANRIDTQGQLAMLADALQAEIDARTELRRGLYREKRSGADVGTEIDTINQELRVLRGKLKTCKFLSGLPMNCSAPDGIPAGR